MLQILTDEVDLELLAGFFSVVFLLLLLLLSLGLFAVDLLVVEVPGIFVGLAAQQSAQNMGLNYNAMYSYHMCRL